MEAFADSEVKITYPNILRKVRNNLTAAMNQFPQVLPKYLIILVANHYMHNPAFVEFELKGIFKKMLNDVGRLLSTRAEQLPKRVSDITTEVFITRPLPKPATALKGDNKFKNSRRYVNQMLDNLSLTMEFKPLNIDAINCTQRALFEKKGDISDYGKERMWQSISEFIKTKDLQVQRALDGLMVKKENVSTQYDERDIKPSKEYPQEYDRYYTRREPDHRYEQHSAAYFGQGDYDDYHKNFDRADYSYDRYNEY